MNVNIIVPWNQAKIGGKRKRATHHLANCLRNIKGWRITGSLNAAADVNYVFVYAENWKMEADPWQKYRDWNGPLAGYFTHVNPVGIKARLWRDAAEAVGLRISESKKYAQELAAYGPTEHVPIPVARDMFCLSAEPANKRPTIGVSGYCSWSDHKGSVMVYDLRRYPLARKWKVVASGKGWPVPNIRNFHVSDMPEFYQSLDAFLCTSLYEGGPFTVFEALSCGTPVVIPRDVGSLDELPDTFGIYRYTAGDFDEMYEALRDCIENKGKHDRVALRALTRGMTAEAYCRQHEEIFEKHFGR